MTTMLIPMSGTVRSWSLLVSHGCRKRRTSHDRSYSTYEVDKSALYANVLYGVPVSCTVIVILLKTDIIWWLNG